MSKVFKIIREGYSSTYIYIADDINQVISAFKHENPKDEIKSIEVIFDKATVLSK